MTFYLQCKGCPHKYKIVLGSEYFLPQRCPQCGYVYRDDAMLRRWLKDLEADSSRGRGACGRTTRS